MEEEKTKPKAEKVARAKKIQKTHVSVKKPKASRGMEIEGIKEKFEQKFQKMSARVGRPTRLGRTTKVTARPEFKPEAFKNFDTQYEASVSAKSIIVPGMSKGQKRRTIKREKLNKKKVRRVGFLIY